MIRKIGEQDRAEYCQMCEEFYHSPAVLHPVDSGHYEKAFDEMMRSDNYLRGYFFIINGEVAGYALLVVTYSQEAGGKAVWLDELYVREQFRNKGIGKEFFAYLEENKPDDIKRFRLEVESDNLKAISLYKRMGYERLGYVQMVKEFD